MINYGLYGNYSRFLLSERLPCMFSSLECMPVWHQDRPKNHNHSGAPAARLLEDEFLMTTMIMLQVMDSLCRVWTIPAEVIQTRFKGFEFAVHKVLDMDSNLWAVSHCKTASVVAYGANKEAAIAAAHELLKVNSVYTIKRAIEEISRTRADLIVAQQQRLATTQTTAAIRTAKQSAKAERQKAAAERTTAGTEAAAATVE